MGIRTLNRRTARAPAHADRPEPPTPPQAPALAPDASTARIPAQLIGTVRRTMTAARRHLIRRLRAWTELARSYAALALTLIPRCRPHRRVTIFEASTGTSTPEAAGTATGTATGTDNVTAPPAGSVPARYHPSPYCQGPGRDATA
ncbi:hypothetical protein [Streptomyces sp. NPDC056628]|uniref:hypothetical protein n=1 Tax=Streptomyces sp. NPDC056628 TaxID=3345882 RepID=UPI0036CBE6D1